METNQATKPRTAEPEDMTYVDTMSLQLDRTLQLIHGTEAWFDEHPEYESLHFAPPVPIDDARNAEAYEIEITRDWLQAFKKVALARYMDLRDDSELGHVIARDVVESWKEPSE